MESHQGARAVMLMAGVVVICAGITLAQAVLVPFLLATFIATVTAPMVTALHRLGVPRALATLAGIVIDLGAIAGLATLVGNSVTAFYQRVPEYQESLMVIVQQGTSWLESRGIRVQSDWLTSVANPGDLMGMLAGLLRNIANVVSNIVLVLVVVVFMLLETTGLREKLMRALPDPQDAERLASAAREVNKYLLVKTGTSALTGISVGVWVAVWDLDLPLLWGLLAFLLNYIPNIGSIVAAVPALLLALLQLGLVPMFGVGAGYLVINFSIGNFLEPRVLGRTLGLSSLVVLLSVVFWGWLLGPIGALLSVPLTMIIKVFLSNTDDLAWVAQLLEPAPAKPRAADSTRRDVPQGEADRAAPAESETGAAEPREASPDSAQ